MAIVRRLTLIALLLALAAVAAAPAQQFEPTFRVDRVDDVRGGLDIRRVALGRFDADELRGEVTTKGRWTTQRLRDASGSICLRLYTRRDPEADPPDYLVCATAPAEGDALVGRVLRDRANGLPTNVGEAIVARPTRRRVTLRFEQDLLGRRARRVRFAAETVLRGPRCARPVGCRDTAPDAPATAELPLRSTS